MNTRALLVLATFATFAAACGDTNAGRLCEPGDTTVCGPGFQCLTFCDATSEPQSICTPSFGAEAGASFADEALIDGKPAFGQLGNVKHFARDLKIKITGVKGVVLPLVEDVAGDLDIEGTDVECLALPRLLSVAGAIHIDGNARLVKSELDSLKSAHDITIANNSALPSTTLPALTGVGGDLSISTNHALSTISAPALTTIGGAMSIQDNALHSVDMSALQSVTGCIDVDFDDGTCALPPRLQNAACCTTAPTIVGGGPTCAQCP